MTFSELCPIASLMMEVFTPDLFRTVANEWRATWKVIGYARRSEQVKIKRKPFEMSEVSVFCQVVKMQKGTEY